MAETEPLDLEAIEERADFNGRGLAALVASEKWEPENIVAQAAFVLLDDVPDVAAEVRRLREENARVRQQQTSLSSGIVTMKGSKVCRACYRPFDLESRLTTATEALQYLSEDHEHTVKHVPGSKPDDCDGCFALQTLSSIESKESGHEEDPQAPEGT